MQSDEDVAEDVGNSSPTILSKRSKDAGIMSYFANDQFAMSKLDV
jgi:hypothetical protein